MKHHSSFSMRLAASLFLGAPALAHLACTSNTSSGGGSSGGSGGTVTEYCSYGLFSANCQSYTGTQESVASEISACEQVFGGASIASCPVGAIGYCKGISGGDTTSEISYYPGDAGVLTLQDLCNNSGGTYSATP